MSLNSKIITKKIDYLINNYIARKKMSINGKKYIDNKGLERLVNLLKDITSNNF